MQSFDVGSDKVAIVSAIRSAIYYLLGVCPAGIVSWTGSTGSSALKRGHAEVVDCSTSLVCAGKLITGRAVEDSCLTKGLMPVTSAILLDCSSSKSNNVYLREFFTGKYQFIFFCFRFYIIIL